MLLSVAEEEKQSPTHLYIAVQLLRAFASSYAKEAQAQARLCLALLLRHLRHDLSKLRALVTAEAAVLHWMARCMRPAAPPRFAPLQPYPSSRAAAIDRDSVDT
jgi:hypothetical protein